MEVEGWMDRRKARNEEMDEKTNGLVALDMVLDADATKALIVGVIADCILYQKKLIVAVKSNTSDRAFSRW